MAISNSTDSSSVRYLLNVRALTPFVCPCSRFLLIPAYHYRSFYHLLPKGKSKIHILDCYSFVSLFHSWQESRVHPQVHPNSNLSETVHQHTPLMHFTNLSVSPLSTWLIIRSSTCHLTVICFLFMSLFAMHVSYGLISKPISFNSLTSPMSLLVRVDIGSLFVEPKKY